MRQKAQCKKVSSKGGGSEGGGLTFCRFYKKFAFKYTIGSKGFKST